MRTASPDPTLTMPHVESLTVAASAPSAQQFGGVVASKKAVVLTTYISADADQSGLFVETIFAHCVGQTGWISLRGFENRAAGKSAWNE
jgi:hypothetical protein